MVDAVPAGSPHVIPYLVVEGADEAIEFYKSVLGATERMCMPGPEGRIGHAELEIGESLVMLADEVPDIGLRSPRGFGGTPVAIYVYVEDVDAAFTRALAAGSKSLRPVEDRFYGDRAGQLEDPWGHVWDLATHIEDVDPEEMAARAAKLMA